jgi:hypothetical protein
VRTLPTILMFTFCATVAAAANPNGQQQRDIVTADVVTADVATAGVATADVAAAPTSAQQAVLDSIERAGLYRLDVDDIVRHDHAQLDVVVAGSPVTIPEVGVDMDTMTAAPIHTHGTDGRLHIEADSLHTHVPVTIRSFLAVWGVGTTHNELCTHLAGGPCAVTVTVDGDVTTFEHEPRDGETVEITLDPYT